MKEIRMDGISGRLYTTNEFVDEIKKVYPRFNRGLLYYYKAKKMTENTHFVKKDLLTLYTQQAVNDLQQKYQSAL